MDRFEISTLRSYYGALLTQRQNDLLVMHYDEDLSFGEIANIVGISRQAVLERGAADARGVAAAALSRL